MKYLFVLTLLAMPQIAMADESEVARIQRQFDRVKPDAKALAFYSLDWATDLKAALARANKERRPVFLIANTNITAGCNFYSGHT